MRLAELVGLDVHSESGKHLGRVHDVRAELRSDSLAITGLLIGGPGLMERLGLGVTRRRSHLRGHTVIPWDRVVRADGRGIVVTG
jgi:sporulation protein YlmC with PRC-barrel domain